MDTHLMQNFLRVGPAKKTSVSAAQEHTKLGVNASSVLV